MTNFFIYEFIRKHLYGVISTVSDKNLPESALIGIAVSEDLEIIFDTVNSSRKYKNILQNPNVAIVIGWDNEVTLQLEGTAQELTPADASYKELYYGVFPDAKIRAETWPDIVHFVVKPNWIRYSNLNDPNTIEEKMFD